MFFFTICLSFLPSFKEWINFARVFDSNLQPTTILPPSFLISPPLERNVLPSFPFTYSHWNKPERIKNLSPPLTSHTSLINCNLWELYSHGWIGKVFVGGRGIMRRVNEFFRQDVKIRSNRSKEEYPPPQFTMCQGR